MAENRDTVLELLLGIQEDAEKEDAKFECPITLNVKGMLVSGILISRHQYFKQFQHATVREGIRRVWKEMLEEEQKQQQQPKSEMPLEYIHLKEVKFFMPGQKPIPANSYNALWRGRLSSVDGFICGILAEAPETDENVS